MWPRIQSVELHELSVTPQPIRESIVETLGRGLRWGRFYHAMAPSFLAFCERAKCDRILDLCSGSGEPAACLLDATAERGLPLPHFTVTDLLPNPELMHAAAARHPSHMQVVTEPVDATAVPRALDQPARSIFNGFHHIPPPLAAQILKDTIEARRAIFILEAFPRSPLRLAATLPMLGLAMAALPLVTERRRLLKTLCLPVTVPLGLWDGLISAFRMYEEPDLRAMVAGAQAYDWRFEEIPFAVGGRAVAFSGVPRPGD